MVFISYLCPEYILSYTSFRFWNCLIWNPLFWGRGPTVSELGPIRLPQCASQDPSTQNCKWNTVTIKVICSYNFWKNQYILLWNVGWGVLLCSVVHLCFMGPKFQGHHRSKGNGPKSFLCTQSGPNCWPEFYETLGDCALVVCDQLIRNIHWKCTCWNSSCTLQWIFHQLIPDE